MRFQAKLIELGRVTGGQDFDVEARQGQDLHAVRDAAYKEAHDGIDPFSGRWVEVKQITSAAPVPDYVRQAEGGE